MRLGFSISFVYGTVWKVWFILMGVTLGGRSAETSARGGCGRPGDDSRTVIEVLPVDGARPHVRPQMRR
jgi:hypothetical protein